MCSSSEIGVDGLGFYLDLFSKLVNRFECGLSMDGGEVSFLKKGVLVINIYFHGV